MGFGGLFTGISVSAVDHGAEGGVEVVSPGGAPFCAERAAVVHIWHTIVAFEAEYLAVVVGNFCMLAGLH